ncbi:hypothetical protein H9658_07090 [Xanthomonas sp. Sa3BUA13]|nr:hypothetical protein [Xanthomonas surreyensis]MBD7921710.1 hypothetical protein [Xanthomonas surreyensis]
MKQFFAAKSEYPDLLLFFRMGDVLSGASAHYRAESCCRGVAGYAGV